MDAWRADDYPCDDYPAVAEIFEWARDPEIGALRFLRPPQLRALETYGYLRLVCETPHVFDLYNVLFPLEKDLPGLHEALSVPEAAFRASNYSSQTLWQKVKTDDQFVQDFGLQALRETLTLAYPSYILALAMGAGKTILIGAVDRIRSLLKLKTSSRRQSSSASNNRPDWCSRRSTTGGQWSTAS